MKLEEKQKKTRAIMYPERVARFNDFLISRPDKKPVKKEKKVMVRSQDREKMKTLLVAGILKRERKVWEGCDSPSCAVFVVDVDFAHALASRASSLERSMHRASLR